MHWHSPNWLWTLWLLPVVAWLLVRAQRKRQAAARTFATGRMRTRLLPETSPGRMWTKGTLLIAGLALLIVAAARPQYGVYYEQVAQRGVDLFVLLDVSRSMLAEDIAPNRLERAKSDIVDLLERIPRDRVGLIVFAGKPVLRVPLTNDHAFFRYMLREVDTESAPIGGSLIGDAIRQALAAMEPRSDRDQVIVLITDGEDHDSFPGDAAKTAAERGVKIIAVGLGDTQEGARIPVPNPAGGGFIKDAEGREVWSKMREDLLKDIALTTSGAYVPARTMAYDLGQIYDDHLAGLTRGEIRTEKRRRFREQFQWFTALGLALLAGDWMLVRFRPRAAAVTALLFATGLASPLLADDTSRQVREGISAFDAGDFSAAAELFAAAATAAPDDPRITFNEGCAQAARQADEEAREFFYKSALARDTALSAGSHYNLGCLAASAAQREFGADPLEASPDQRQAGLASLTRAAGHFRDALRMDAEHADARHNLETIRLWIKQMKALWEERDRAQRRKEQNLLQMLKDLDARQSALRSSLGAARQQPASPLRQQGLDELEQQQRGLADEVEPLKEKISAELAAAGQQDPGGGAAASSGTPTDDLNRAIEVLHQWADELHDSFVRAANNMAADKFDEARQAQRESLETVNQMYEGLAPFPELLQTALISQKALVGQSRDVLGVAPDSAAESDADDDEKSDNKSPARPGLEPDELAWRQRRVGGWANALGAKAGQGLPMLEQQMSEQAEAANSRKKDEDDSKQDGGADEQPSEEAADLEPMMESLRRAVELTPEVQALAFAAADLVQESQFEPALPKQEQALRLLEEIAETLPKNDENQQQQNQQEQQQNQNQEEDKQDDSSQQQDSSQQPQSDDKQESQPQEDSAQQDQKQQDDGQQQQQQQQQQSSAQQSQEQTDPSQQRMTAAQAEAILQRVRDRERQHRQVEKRMRRLLQKRVPPDRDW